MKEGRIQGWRFLRRAPFPPFATDKSISVLGRGVVHESAAGGRGQRPAGTSPAARGGTGPGGGRSPPPHGPGASSLPQARPAPLIFDPQVLLLKGGGTLPPGKSQCALGQGQAPRGNMSSCPRTALLLTSCARAMAAGTPSCSASVLGGMMCHGCRPLKLFPVHAGPPSQLVFFPVPRRTHPGPARLRVWSSVPACVPLLREFGPFEPVEQQQSKEESSVGVAGGEGRW